MQSGRKKDKRSEYEDKVGVHHYQREEGRWARLSNGCILPGGV